MATSRAIIHHLFFFLMPATCAAYCVPSNASCWPDQAAWDELGAALSGWLWPLDPETGYQECWDQGSNAYGILAAAHGMCMHAPDCSREFCQGGNATWNVPQYSVEVAAVADIQAALAFANEHNIAVTVKSTGHSFVGASTARDSLMIWLRNLPEHDEGGNDTIAENFTDSCGSAYPDGVLRIGGGQIWADVYPHLGSDFHLIGGWAWTVSAAGGWLQGGGVSPLSRTYGMGIDNVLRFEVVLANGSLVYADACSEPDLFWALRGGGGGTFGVVTAAWYRLHPAIPLQITYIGLDPASEDFNTTQRDALVDFWVRHSPRLDNRWGGMWSPFQLFLVFSGSAEDAQSTLLDALDEWRAANGSPPPAHIAGEFPSLYEFQGGDAAVGDPSIYPTGTASVGQNMASRFVPQDWVLEHPDEARDLILELFEMGGLDPFNYFLGGVMQDVPANATAIQPAAREAIWMLQTYGDEAHALTRRTLPNSITGVCNNHHATLEPDWRHALWGSNFPRLQELKERYDPENRFNCWHCVGYIGTEMEASDMTPKVTSSSSTTSSTGATSAALQSTIRTTMSTSTTTTSATIDDMISGSARVVLCSWLLGAACLSTLVPLIGKGL